MDASKIGNITIFLLLLTNLFTQTVVSQNRHEHVSIMNRLGNGKNMTLHCQSKDTDLGQQIVIDGDEFGWDFSVNIWGTTLFYCDLEWDSVQQFSFVAYAFQRDYDRCQNQCLWLIATEGVYNSNAQTGLWEYTYHWSSWLWYLFLYFPE